MNTHRCMYTFLCIIKYTAGDTRTYACQYMHMCACQDVGRKVKQGKLGKFSARYYNGGKHDTVCLFLGLTEATGLYSRPDPWTLLQELPVAEAGTGWVRPGATQPLSAAAPD